MAKPLIDVVLLNARTLVADRRRRLRGAEAVTARWTGVRRLR